MSVTRKLRQQQDVQRGTDYAMLLDNWICERDQWGEPKSITLLFNALVQHGRHEVITEPYQPGGAS